MESHESDTKIVKTYWIEQAADSVTNANYFIRLVDEYRKNLKNK